MSVSVKRYSRIKYLIKRASFILSKRKEITVVGMALSLGYSVEYFKRSILPMLLEALDECVDYNGRKLYWNEKCKPEEVVE